MAVPSAMDYTDASPKGSIDAGIRDLIDGINDKYDGLVTTSSCGGRPIGWQAQHIVHDWATVFGMQSSEQAVAYEPSCSRLIHFKFEPMILHILTASCAHAQLVLQAALAAGFRESGAVLGSEATPVVGIRSMGLFFQSLIGVEQEGERVCIVSSPYLNMVMKLANDRFVENARRIARFQEGLRKVFSTKARGKWEDPELRRTRKREAGLKKKAELRGENQTVCTDTTKLEN
ncbi:hypothetical protein P8C59_001202 [Phyllachora maydis]|uniref:tRNA(Phe) 7-[(3-amino-3-carboxypropyl)-4-demethylwyosine(37)-N(4)]-methyltransferase n=1 Tax=Phyllachora maydis TaxID=1825666 RepID=A0AAD9HXR3_9PEZI|nr:hypothetical protein P8C59_001202 [Phyllachora maydis]